MVSEDPEEGAAGSVPAEPVGLVSWDPDCVGFV